MSSEIIVSISCITYNHKPFIRQCLDGFMMQKMQYSFEIVIYDDASTDGTREIIEEYCNKFPDVFIPYFQTENQFSKGIRGITARFNFPRCRGKYIALCEGDDYWTDPYKLQKQVEFMERNQQYIACFHNAWIDNKLTGEKIIYHKWDRDRIIDKKEIIEKGGYIFPTASLVFRNIISFHLLVKNSYCPAGDLVLLMELMRKGLIYYLDDVMSVYTRHSYGVYSSLIGKSEKMIEFELPVIGFLQIIKYEFPKEYLSIFNRQIKYKCYNLMKKYNMPIYRIIDIRKYIGIIQTCKLIYIVKFDAK